MASSTHGSAARPYGMPNVSHGSRERAPSTQSRPDCYTAPPSRSTSQTRTHAAVGESQRTARMRTRRERADRSREHGYHSDGEVNYHPQITQRVFQLETNQRNAAAELVRLTQEQSSHHGLIGEADRVLRENHKKIEDMSGAIVQLQIQLAQLQALLNRDGAAPNATPTREQSSAQEYLIGTNLQQSPLSAPNFGQHQAEPSIVGGVIASDYHQRRSAPPTPASWSHQGPDP